MRRLEIDEKGTISAERGSAPLGVLLLPGIGIEQKALHLGRAV